MSQIATFGGGCFWGVEYLFAQQTGVLKTSVGYMGGTHKNPSYQQVCSGATGHAEVVQVVYDPQQISYQDLLQLFWANHDFTTLNRQGPDIGSQYRSVIFFHNPDQANVAEQQLLTMEQNNRYNRPIVTTIEPATDYWLAEDYHQHYVAKREADATNLP